MNYLMYGLLFMAVAGCASDAVEVLPADSQLQSRQMQTREYDSLSRVLTMRSIISTLQDLGFVIDRADLAVGAVTATRHDRYTLRITVTVRELESERIAVRANARVEEQQVDDPRTYQDFFVALDKAMFLTAEHID